jgi:hypothetical protein
MRPRRHRKLLAAGNSLPRQHRARTLTEGVLAYAVAKSVGARARPWTGDASLTSGSGRCPQCRAICRSAPSARHRFCEGNGTQWKPLRADVFAGNDDIGDHIRTAGGVRHRDHSVLDASSILLNQRQRDSTLPMRYGGLRGPADTASGGFLPAERLRFRAE